MRKINHIMVHCTGTTSDVSVDTIVDYWKLLGWKRPGYHFIVLADGFIVPLLHVGFIANGCKGWNADTIHVAYVGGVEDGTEGKYADTRTEAQKQTLRHLLVKLKFLHPSADILGHRDIWGKNPAAWQKACPCFDAQVEYAYL